MWPIHNYYNDLSGNEGNLLSLWMVEEDKIYDRVQKSALNLSHLTRTL